MSCADWKRIFDVTCPARLVRYTSSPAASGSNTTIASADRAPFFVAPRVSASMPARQVRSAGAHPSAATAFATRAPSRCTRSPRPCAIAASAAISSTV